MNRPQPYAIVYCPLPEKSKDTRGIPEGMRPSSASRDTSSVDAAVPEQALADQLLVQATGSMEGHSCKRRRREVDQPS